MSNTAELEARVAELERKLELVTDALLYHTHRHQDPKDNPYNPFNSYSEGEEPSRVGKIKQLVDELPDNTW